MNKVDLIFDNEAWWVFEPSSRNWLHAFEVDNEIGPCSRNAQENAFRWAWRCGYSIVFIDNPERSFGTSGQSEVIYIRDDDGIPHWFVADLFNDGEIGGITREFPTKDEAKKWLNEFE